MIKLRSVPWLVLVVNQQHHSVSQIYQRDKSRPGEAGRNGIIADMILRLVVWRTSAPVVASTSASYGRVGGTAKLRRPVLTAGSYGNLVCSQNSCRRVGIKERMQAFRLRRSNPSMPPSSD